MIYRIFVTSFLLFCTVPACAQGSRYRVEILVLTQLKHDAVPREVTSLENFSDALDFLAPPEEEAETSPEEPAADEPGEAAVESPPGEGEAEPIESSPEELLNAVVPVPEMGPQMQDAWRRLRLSGPLRPLQFLAWEQGPDAPFPVLRIHDLDAVWVDDPWAEQRVAISAPAEGNVEGGTAVSAAASPTPVEAVTGDGEPAAGAADALPPPIVYYQLDGIAGLTRSRFLHLRLVVEWREPVFDEPAAVVEGEVMPKPDSYRVFRLEQSRPVRVGRMEYFDGPVLGVLAWITALDEPAPNEAPVPDA